MRISHWGTGLGQLLIEFAEGLAQGIGLELLVLCLLSKAAGELVTAEGSFERSSGQVIMAFGDCELCFPLPLGGLLFMLLALALEQVFVGDGDGDLCLDLEQLIFHIGYQLFQQLFRVFGLFDEVVDIGS